MCLAADNSKEKTWVSITACSLLTNISIIAYRVRQGQHQTLQKEWIKEQKRENQWIQQNNEREEKEYAEQTDNLTRMRGMLEDDMADKKNAQVKNLQATNQDLAQQKRDRESNWKDNQES